MNTLNVVKYWEGGGRHGYTFICPGCKSSHTIHTSSGGWLFNGSLEKPTFTPSILVSTKAYPDAEEGFEEFRTAQVCHSFVTNGLIQFLGDCTHSLAGQTVNLLVIEDK